MKIRLLAFFILLFSLGKSQISITGTNMPVAGDTARMSLASVAALTTNTSLTSYTATGANFTWNFDSLKATGQVLRSFVPAMSTPYFFFGTGFGEKIADTINIPIPTFSIQITDMYNFYKKNSTSFYVDGLGLGLFGFGVPNFYSDKDELYMLPVNYLDRDSTTFKFSTLTNSLIPFSYKKQGYRITEADGYGTVNTPLGSFQCLRVVTTQFSIDSLRLTLPIGTFTLPINVGFPNYVRSYQWLTTTEHVPVLEVSGNVIFNTFAPTQVRYRDKIRSFTGVNEIESDGIALAIYPNPATTQLNMIIPAKGKFTLEITDANGRLVSVQKFDNENSINQNVVDISNLSQGLYTGKLNNGKAVKNFKFIKQ